MTDNNKSASGGRSRWLAGLRKTRNAIAGVFSGLSSSTTVDSYLDELEDALLCCDVGFDASQAIVEKVRTRTKRGKVDQNVLVSLLKDELAQILASAEQSFNPEQVQKPAVILMLGVNGVGKTTTVAKIANYYMQHGHSAMLAACDTYRAAAIEQLQIWGKRIAVPVIAQGSGADPAAVAHDALHAAVAKNIGLLILDTAGRQHSRDDLMRQIGKIRRVVAKIEPTAPHETLITIDGATGQNALSQVEQFNQQIALDGICISKLDGTAKGGIAVALTQKFNLPVRFVGLGEGINDLAPFRVQEYIDSLFPGTDQPSE